MRSTRKTPTSLLALATAAAVLVCAPAAALAGAGGTSAPSTATGAGKVHPTGIATWFGPGFYGKQTACGQTLTPSVVGVANRTLPCGTLVKVVYRGHTLTVPVVDRGPYAHHADWDLTAGAAQALGITETVRIAAAVVGATANVPTLGLPPAPPTLAGGASAG
jgi:peptidoglycan lytic transglycosylase